MPLMPVKLKPGVDTNQTPTLLGAGWADANRVRFRDGLPEQLGGWVQYFPLSIERPARALHPWQSLATDDYLAIGTESNLYTLQAGVLVDRTPFVSDEDVAPSFSTTISSAIVTIDDAGSNTADGQFINVTVPVAVGGIVIQGTYEVLDAVSANQYTITAASAATATVATGGAVPRFDTTITSSTVLVTLANHGYSIGQTFTVQISTTVGGLTLEGYYTVLSVPTANTLTIDAGSAATSTANANENAGDAHFIYYVTSAAASLTTGGYGLGGYGMGPYGIGGPVLVAPTVGYWTLDNWGEILIANLFEGGIYEWSPSGVPDAATIIAGAPTINNGVFVATPQRQLVAWASETGSVQDPLLVRWSDVDDYNTWIASSTNQAGSFRIATGSRIVAGISTPQRQLIWTDLDLWSMTYIGTPFVYGFNKIGAQCGAMSAMCVAALDDKIYWLSAGNFMVLHGGAVSNLPCSVWDVMWQDLDTSNAHKITAASNSIFDEVAWYYPSLSGGLGENDRYVKYNTRENLWDIGELDRTAWCDQSMLGPPIGGGADSYLYQHEIGTTANGEAMEAYVTSGRFMLAEGDTLAFIDQIVPDMIYSEYQQDQDAQIGITLYTYAYAESTPRTHGPYTMNRDQLWITTRARNRQAAAKIQGIGTGGFWRLGDIRLRIAPAGRR